MGSIYKITNSINNKVYIGYTGDDINVRFRKHIVTSYYNKNKNKKMTRLNEAIVKYGEFNFKIEKIIDVGDDWKDKEMYYIKIYNSQNIEFGYNMTKGGELPPKTRGEKNVQSNITDDDFYKIVKYLKDCEITMSEIAKIFKVSNSTIERINAGSIRNDESYKYPIRKYSPFEVKALDIISLLAHTDLNYKEISNLTDCVKTTVMEINMGHSNVKLIKDLKFPINKNSEYNKHLCEKPDVEESEIVRIKFHTFLNDVTKYKKYEIINTILSTNLTFSKIAELYSCDPSKVSNINIGKADKRELECLKYPLNKNKKYNLEMIDRIKAVETIPLIGE